MKADHETSLTELNCTHSSKPWTGLALVILSEIICRVNSEAQSLLQSAVRVNFCPNLINASLGGLSVSFSQSILQLLGHTGNKVHVVFCTLHHTAL